MNIQQFQYILAVAESRHFESAAEKCFITQSTLSTMIAKFEDETGVKIFDRKKKPVEITREGQAIIKQLTIINNNISQLDELIKEIKGEIKGRLAISVIPTVAPFLLPLFLQDFALKFPDLHIEIKEQTTPEIIRQLKSRDLDIGIVSVPLQDKEIVELKLYDEPFVFYDAGRKNQARVSAKDIDVNNLWLMEEGHCMRTQVLRFCEMKQKHLNPRRNIDFKAGSIDSLLRFVKANNAATLLPYLSTAGFSGAEKQYVEYFTAPIPLRTIGLVVHQHFVKKKILHLLQKEIINKVLPLIPETDSEGNILSPV